MRLVSTFVRKEYTQLKAYPEKSRKVRGDGSLGHTVYRKLTHTDRYLNAFSHHHLLYEVPPKGSYHLEAPIWILGSDLMYNGNDLTLNLSLEFEEIHEQSVLTLHFRFNGELLVDIDDKIVGTLGPVPRIFTHVYPLIDLYGRVSQVSIMLYPCNVVGESSLDLPDIAENKWEESLAEMIWEDSTEASCAQSERLEIRTKRCPKAYSQDKLVDSYESLAQPGPSSYNPSFK